jgi:capsular polysaccharide biosynthesis protein
MSIRIRLQRRLARKSWNVVSLADTMNMPQPPTISAIRPQRYFQSTGPAFIHNGRHTGGEHVFSIAPEEAVYEFRNADVIGGTNLIVQDGCAIHPDICDPHRDMFSCETNGVATYLLGRNKLLFDPSTTATIPDGISLLGECTGNYAHWLIETLPKLAHVRGLYPGVPFLVDGWIHPRLREALAILDADSRRVVPIDRWQMAHVGRLIYPTQPCYTAPENRRYFFTGQSDPATSASYPMSPDALESLRSMAVERASTVTPAARHKRVYLKRTAISSGNPRQMLGSEAVESVLVKEGFHVVDAATLSFPEQVMLLNSAEIVVAPIGAAMANCIFAPRGLKVICLAPYYPGADYHYFSNMMNAADHKLVYVLGEQIEDQNTHIMHRDYRANVSGMVQALVRFTASRESRDAATVQAASSRASREMLSAFSRMH